MLNPATIHERLDLKSTFTLEDRQRNILVASMKQEYFDLLQKLMEEELKAFNFRLMNTPAHDPDAVLVNHLAAQAVTQWYVGFMSRLAEQSRYQYALESGVGTIAHPEPSGVEPDFA
jgi:hypothetical protein